MGEIRGWVRSFIPLIPLIPLIPRKNEGVFQATTRVGKFINPIIPINPKEI
jgi:hypothetical protein